MLRTQEAHRRHCRLLSANIPARLRTHYSMVYGINNLSPLDAIPHFSITKCVPVDTMHIVCEGALPYCVKGLLSKVFSESLVSVSWVNTQIDSFPYVGEDKKNRPSLLERGQFEGLNTGKIGQSGRFLYSVFNPGRH